MNSDPRIDQMLEGRLDEQEWEALQEEMREDPALRERFLEQKWLHARLLVDRDLLAELEVPDPVTSRTSGRIGWAAAAVVALLGALLFVVGRSDAPEMVATLAEADGCRWEGSELPTTEGARLGPGLLALAEGMATIRFESGATVTLEAPTRLQIDSAMRCRLLEGSVVADVPEGAEGFTIDTEQLEVIDLGTRFGVTSSPVGGSHVFVFDGEVKVLEESNPEAQHVLSGKSLHFGEVAPAPGEEIARESPIPQREGDWLHLSTADGEGRDTFIRREHSAAGAGSGPLLMVKHTDLAPGNERRGLLALDLGSIGSIPLNEVILSLKVESSGLGFSALVPDSRFAVYGLLDPASSDWDAETLDWKGAGIFSEETLDPERFARLAEFTLPKASPHSVIDIASEELTRFVDARRGTTITLVLVRETGEHDKQGLVHAFASSEHPIGPPPTLWIQTDTEP